MRVLLCLAPALLVFFLPSILGEPPTDLEWKIEDYKVNLKWHCDSPSKNSIERFYISVQEVKSGTKMGAPEFLYVNKKERTVSIVGLKQNKDYSIKVVSYLKNGVHEPSVPVHVNTAHLGKLKPRDIKVSAITANSALFRWEYDASHILHNYRFRLLCEGMQQYTDANNTLVQERHNFSHVAYTTSKGWNTFHASSLPPNTKYNCDLTAFVWRSDKRKDPTKIPPFTTSYAAPTPPPTPTISVPHEKSKHDKTMFTIKLLPTTDQFGPISHYKVFAVPVEQSANQQAATMPYTPMVEIKSLLSTAVSSELVAEVTEAIPFLIGTYTILPDHLIVDSYWLGKAFKPLSHYAIVVAAFTKSQEGDMHQYFSFSAPSDPPVYIDEDMHTDAFKRVQHSGERFTTIVLGTLFAVAIIFCISFVVVFANSYCKGKKRDAYYFAVNDESNHETSEDELFSKRTNSDKKPLIKHTPIPAPPSGKTLAEWAVENIFHNPEFEDSVYRSPEMMKEMDETMHMIAKKQNEVRARESDETKCVGENPISAESFITPHNSVAENLDDKVDNASADPTEATELTLDMPSADLDNSVTYEYKSKGKKKKDKRPTSSTKSKTPTDSPLPSYYYTTTNPEPDVCIEEYNVTAGATPHSTIQHTVPPSQLKEKKKSQTKKGTSIVEVQLEELDQTDDTFF